jgi:uncharacterized membrane protein YedE/YeeE
VTNVLFYVLLGTVFGFVLSRSGATDYNYIQGMFLFERFQLYGIIGAAIVFTAPGIWAIKRFGRTASGSRISLPRKSLNFGTVFGSLLFGVGWSMTGMCPGPIFVNVGEGKVYAVAALIGALTGAAAFGILHPRLQRLFGLPGSGSAALPVAIESRH